MRTRLKFTRVNETYKLSEVHSFTFTRDLPYIVYILFTRVKITLQWKSTFQFDRHKSDMFLCHPIWIGTQSAAQFTHEKGDFAAVSVTELIEVARH